MVHEVVGNSIMKDLDRLTCNTRMIRSIIIEHCLWLVFDLGDWRRFSAEAILKLVLSEACVLSRLPIVCGCFIVAYTSVIPKICVTTATMVEINADPLSVMRVVAKYECFVMISIITLDTFATIASISG